MDNIVVFITCDFYIRASKVINGATDVLLSMLMELLKLGNLATKDKFRKNSLVKEKAMQSIFSQFHNVVLMDT